MKSRVAGIEWPAIADGPSQLLALAWQLEQSQWWSGDKLRRHQERQLLALIEHAVTAAHYEESLAGLAFGDTFDPDAWARVPILARDTLIAAGDRILSRKYPQMHGKVIEVSTSRTTGTPVRVRSTEIVFLFWKAITLRDHAWHRRDLDARLAAIRYTAGDQAKPPDGARGHGWGVATAELAPQAPLSLLSVASTTDEQVAWLVREDPAYLLAYPTVFDAIARKLAETGRRLPSLREVRTVSEALSPESRVLARQLGVPLVDMYSAQEVGYLALQCPAHAHYHVQSESVLVEILDDAGAPCRPGETGRVIVTDLHNFASPILRYDLGDFAEVGEPCPCGRGLPVLNRIVGRRRGMLRYPDGRTIWPVFTVACRQAARYRECQLVQESVHALRLKVVPLDSIAVDEAALIAALRATLGSFEVTVEIVDALRGPTGKLEEFVSLA